MMRTISVALIALSACVPAHADIYSRTDASGLVVMSNVPPPTGAAAVHSVAPVPSRDRAPAVSRASFPRVSEQEQRARDADRQAILQQELDAENAALRKALQERLDAALLNRHRANIEAIKRELGGGK